MSPSASAKPDGVAVSVWFVVGLAGLIVTELTTGTWLGASWTAWLPACPRPQRGQPAEELRVIGQHPDGTGVDALLGDLEDPFAALVEGRQTHVDVARGLLVQVIVIPVRGRELGVRVREPPRAAPLDRCHRMSVAVSRHVCAMEVDCRRDAFEAIIRLMQVVRVLDHYLPAAPGDDCRAGPDSVVAEDWGLRAVGQDLLTGAW